MTGNETMEMLIKRVEALERWREEDRREHAKHRQDDLTEAKMDRHDFRGDVATLLAANTLIANALQKQVTEMDKVSGGAGDAAKISWMQWVIGAVTAGLLLALGYIFRIKQ